MFARFGSTEAEEAALLGRRTIVLNIDGNGVGPYLIKLITFQFNC